MEDASLSTIKPLATTVWPRKFTVRLKLSLLSKSKSSTIVIGIEKVLPRAVPLVVVIPKSLGETAPEAPAPSVVNHEIGVLAATGGLN